MKEKLVKSIMNSPVLLLSRWQMSPCIDFQGGLPHPLQSTHYPVGLVKGDKEGRQRISMGNSCQAVSAGAKNTAILPCYAQNGSDCRAFQGDMAHPLRFTNGSVHLLDGSKVGRQGVIMGSS